MKNKKLFSYFIINLIIIISTTLGILWSTFGGKNISLTTYLFYTTQSNILVMALSIIFAIKQYKQLKGKEVAYSSNLMLIKYISTIAITITFIVYSGLLLPEIIAKKEFERFFTVNNFTLHYITPILAIVSFFVFDKNYLPKTKHAFLTIIAPLVYFIFAILLSLLPGNGFFGTETAPSKFPYFFLNYETNGWFNTSGGIFKLGVFWWVIILFVAISALSYGYIALFNKFHKNKLQAQVNEQIKQEDQVQKTQTQQSNVEENFALESIIEENIIEETTN